MKIRSVAAAPQSGATNLPREDATGCVSMNSVSFAKENHGVGLNEFHFEWYPKYRYNCMRNEYINKEIEKIIRQVAEENGIFIKKIAVGSDHVHLHVALKFSMSISRAMMLLKGKSAYLIFQRFPNFRLRYPRGHFWSPGKFSRSVSDVTSEVVDCYISKQQFDALMNFSEASDQHQMKLDSFL